MCFFYSGVAHLQPAKVGFVVWRHGGVEPEFYGQILHTDLVCVVVHVVLVLTELAPVALIGSNEVLEVLFNHK